MARLRYIGTFAHRLTAGGRVLADVVHGTEFDCPDSWVGPIMKRGTPVELVVDPPTVEVVEPVAVEPEAEVTAPTRGRRRKG